MRIYPDPRPIDSRQSIAGFDTNKKSSTFIFLSQAVFSLFFKYTLKIPDPFPCETFPCSLHSWKKSVKICYKMFAHIKIKFIVTVTMENIDNKSRNKILQKECAKLMLYNLSHVKMCANQRIPLYL